MGSYHTIPYHTEPSPVRVIHQAPVEHSSYETAAHYDDNAYNESTIDAAPIEHAKPILPPALS